MVYVSGCFLNIGGAFPGAQRLFKLRSPSAGNHAEGLNIALLGSGIAQKLYMYQISVPAYACLGLF